MFLTQDQISVAAKANLESGFTLYASLSNQTLQSVEKLITLNLAAAKAAMEESSAATRQLLAARDPQEFMTLVSAQMKPNFDKAVAYGNHVAGIANGSRDVFSKAAEEQVADAQRRLGDMMEQALKSAPAGTESLVAAMKTAFDNASSSYDQMARAGKQAAEVIEANLNAATSQIAKSADAATTNA